LELDGWAPMFHHGPQSEPLQPFLLPGL
jgi:hypothetical protein